MYYFYTRNYPLEISSSIQVVTLYIIIDNANVVYTIFLGEHNNVVNTLHNTC